MILSCGGPPEWAWRSRSRNVLGTGRLLPALEFSDAGLGIAQDQAIGGERVQRELRARGHIAELGQAVLPVVAVGGHHVRAVDGVGLGARRERPRRRASGRPRAAGWPRAPPPCRGRRDASRLPGWCWACRRSRRRSGRPGGRPPGRWRRSTAAAPAAGYGARADLDILERVVLAAERERLARPAPAQDLDALLEARQRDAPSGRRRRGSRRADSRCPRPG